MEAVEWVVAIVTLVSVFFMDYYGFKVCRMAWREIKAVKETRERAEITVKIEITKFTDKISAIAESYDETISEVMGSVMETKKVIDETVARAREMMDPAVGVAMGEAVVLNSLQTLGMQNLKDLGDKGHTVRNARLGLQAVGNEIAKGAGVNELLEKVEPLVQTMGGGAGVLDQFKDNPLVQLAIAWKTGGMDGLLGGGGQGAPPAGSTGVVKELKK